MTLDDTAAWIEQAKALLTLSKSSEALEYLNQKLEITPDTALGWALRAWALDELARYQEALDSANRGLAIDSDCSQAWIEKAGTLLKMGRYPEAKVSLNEHFCRTQNHADCTIEAHECWTVKAQIELQNGEYCDALESCKRSRELNPLGRFLDDTVGAILSRQGKYSDAIPYFEKQLRATPNQENTQLSFALALLETRQYYSALAECDDVLGRNRRSSFALAYKGTSYLRLKEYEAAVRAFEHCLEIDRSLEWVRSLKSEAESELRNKRVRKVLTSAAKMAGEFVVGLGLEAAKEHILERRAQSLQNGKIIDGKFFPLVDRTRQLGPPSGG